MLHVHSCYDILHSTIRIESLVEKCEENGLGYAAICDRTLSGWPYLIENCKKKGIKAVLGYEAGDKGWHFFAKNRAGYFEIIKYRNKINSLENIINSENVIKVVNNILLAEKYKDIKQIYFGISISNRSVDTGGIPCVYFPEVCFLDKKDLSLLEMMSDIKYEKNNLEELVYKTSEKLKSDMNISDESVDNIISIVDKIEVFDIKTDFEMLKVYKEIDKNSESILKERVFRNFENSPFFEKPQYVERINRELEVITAKKFSEYILLADAIVRKAKSINAVVGPGRGSSVGSLVVNVLGITIPDPIENKLIFERFISIDRDDYPDIDIDIDDKNRQNLIASLREEYGSEKVVHVGTYGTYGEKLAVREIARKKIIPITEVDNGRYSNLKNTLIGLPHHKSVHAAGIIFSEIDIRELVPVYEYSQDVFVTEYDMDSLNRCGIIKMDILGLSNLSILRDIYGDGNESFSGEDFFKIDLEDESVYDAFATDNCSGIFQLDSRSGRYLLERTNPKNFQDISVLISLNRPGPGQSGMTDEYIERKENGKKVIYRHPVIKSILNDTFGVPVFQEQVMEIAMKLADFSPLQANELRKAMAKKNPQKLIKLEKDFISGMLNHNLDEDTAENMFKEFLEFAGYAFNRAHATAYALITYSLMYAKVHFPLNFYKSLLKYENGKYEKNFELILEAKNNDVDIRGVDINDSFQEAEISGECVIIGFNSLKEIGPAVSDSIVKIRGKENFKDIRDFISRMGYSLLTERVLTILYDSGAMDSLMKRKIPLKTVLRTRDEMKNELKNIMASVFEGKKEDENESNDEIKIEGPLDIVQENIRSYGFLFEFGKVFGFGKRIFLTDSIFKLAIITSIISLGNRYQAFDGVKFYEVSDRHNELTLGEKIIIYGKGRVFSLAGKIEKKEFIISDVRAFLKYYESLKKDLFRMKENGMEILRIEDKKYSLEVRL